MRLIIIAVMTLAQAACGLADVGTTAATAGKSQAIQAEQAQQTMEAAKAKVDAAMAAEQERLRQMESGAGK
jgi:hypothetical protein